MRQLHRHRRKRATQARSSTRRSEALLQPLLAYCNTVLAYFVMWWRVIFLYPWFPRLEKYGEPPQKVVDQSSRKELPQNGNRRKTFSFFTKTHRFGLWAVPIHARDGPAENYPVHQGKAGLRGLTFSLSASGQWKNRETDAFAVDIQNFRRFRSRLWEPTRW